MPNANYQKLIKEGNLLILRANKMLSFRIMRNRGIRERQQIG